MSADLMAGRASGLDSFGGYGTTSCAPVNAPCSQHAPALARGERVGRVFTGRRVSGR